MMCLTRREYNAPLAVYEHYRQFVVIWENQRVTIESEQWVSNVYDLADCDYGESVKEILALDENGNLVKVTTGEGENINTDQENPFYYARMPLMAGNHIAGYVTLTDH